MKINKLKNKIKTKIQQIQTSIYLLCSLTSFPNFLYGSSDIFCLGSISFLHPSLGFSSLTGQQSTFNLLSRQSSPIVLTKTNLVQIMAKQGLDQSILPQPKALKKWELCKGAEVISKDCNYRSQN